MIGGEGDSSEDFDECETAGAALTSDGLSSRKRPQRPTPAVFTTGAGRPVGWAPSSYSDASYADYYGAGQDGGEEREPVQDEGENDSDGGSKVPEDETKGDGDDEVEERECVLCLAQAAVTRFTIMCICASQEEATKDSIDQVHISRQRWCA